jgi:hypothetical protein
MKTKLAALLVLTLAGCGTTPRTSEHGIDVRQTPTWSADDERVFFHGSMGNEFVPERMLRAFMRAYPELFPGGRLAAFGAVDEPGTSWPIGFSRRDVAHLGGPSIGMNCAACHLGEFREAPDRAPVRVIGAPAAFDVYAFTGALAVSMAKTTEPAGMVKYLGAFMGRDVSAQKDAITATVAADPFTSRGMAADALHALRPADLDSDDPVVVARETLRVLYNMRTSLHLPEQLPPLVPVIPGPGRTDAFAVLSVALLGTPAGFDAPVKYGFPWDLDRRTWVHCDGNNQDPLSRNLEATLGLGAPMFEGGRLLDFALLKRQTDITQVIRPPRWPWSVDDAAAARGEKHYRAKCASCHDGVPDDQRLHAPEQVGTDPKRARFFDAKQAELTNRWLASVRVAGYTANTKAYRSTGKYWSPEMDGAWARSPYLHNGSVRTMMDLLTPPAKRPKSFRRGSTVYDKAALGFVDEGAFVLDTTIAGNSNAGHDYGTDLADNAKRDLIEYLKTR